MISIAVLAILKLVSVGSVAAQTNSTCQATGYLIPPGTTSVTGCFVDSHGTYKRCWNSNGTATFVPTATAAEWSTGGSAFLNNIPAGVSCVDPQICYLDADGDGWGGSTSGYFSSCNGGVGGSYPGTAGTYVQTGGDCCDSNANARPGQLSYFTAGMTGGCSGWDYDCSGSTSPNYSGYNVRGTLLNTAGSYYGYTGAANCTGGTTGPFGSIWIWNNGGTPSAACGSAFNSCTTGISLAQSIQVGSCYSAGTMSICHSYSATSTATTSCR